MTHYAGQAALAKYIKDLVEGRIEHPEGAASGRPLATPRVADMPTPKLAPIRTEAANGAPNPLADQVPPSRPRPVMRFTLHWHPSMSTVLVSTS